MYKGLNDNKLEEIINYYKNALKHFYLSEDEYRFELNNHEDVVFRRWFDLNRPIPYGGSNSGYYAFFDEKNTIVADADDILKNEKNEDVWKIKVLHEVRHAYQYHQIKLYQSNQSFQEQVEVIDSWMKNFEKKKKEGATMLDITEKDAIKYSSENWNKI
jgi:hypothetical protein